jgi:hypothetical protein
MGENKGGMWKSGQSWLEAKLRSLKSKNKKTPRSAYECFVIDVYEVRRTMKVYISFRIVVELWNGVAAQISSLSSSHFAFDSNNYQRMRD